MKKNIILSLVFFAFISFAPKNIFCEDNIPFSGGQYVETWDINSFINTPEPLRDGDNFWNWLQRNGYNPTDYIKRTVDVFYSEFHTPNAIGDNSKASCYISIPRDVTTPMPIVVHLYGTKIDPIYRDTLEGSTYASGECIAVTPHYLSQNKSAGKEIHPYMMAESYGQIVKDMLAEVKNLLDQNGIAYTEDLLLRGNSEGGFAALATAKTLQENNIPVTLVAPAAGPYNIEAVVAGAILQPPLEIGWAAPIIATQLFLAATSYSDLFQNSLHESENYIRKIKTNIETFLREPFATEFTNAFLNVENQGEALLAIENTYNSLPPEEKEGLPWGIFRPEVFEEMKADPYGCNLTQFYKNQNVCFWRPEMNVLFLHGQEDLFMPVSMTLWTYQVMKYGYQAPKVDVKVYPGLNHRGCVIPARKDIIDTFCSLLSTGT
jgi:pimeloyl-ACP methyl ester carboxylesterase